MICFQELGLISDKNLKRTSIQKRAQSKLTGKPHEN